MTINSGNQHLHVRIADELKARIEQGIYKEREKLPTEFELSKSLGVSKTILREALKLLELDNIVSVRFGVGTFVNAKPMFLSGIEQLGSVTETIERAGKTPGTQYISTEILEPSDDDRKKFSPKKIHTIAQIERIRTADGQPVVYCIDKVDGQLITLEHIHTQDSIFRLLEQYSKKSISYAVSYIEPIGYHETISPILNCQPDQALLLLKQMHYGKDDEPIFYSANYYRADIFNFYVLRKRM